MRNMTPRTMQQHTDDEAVQLHSKLKSYQAQIASIRDALNSYQEAQTKAEANKAIDLAIEEAFK